VKSKNILEHFRDLPDPREDNRRHQLLDMLEIEGGVITIDAMRSKRDRLIDSVSLGYRKFTPLGVGHCF